MAEKPLCLRQGQLFDGRALFLLLTGERGKGKSTLASQFVVEAMQEGYSAFCYS